MKHDMTMSEIFQLAGMLVQTQGILPQTIRTQGECVAVILAGRELGLPAMASLRLITLVKGKVTIDAAGQVALMQSAGAKVHWLNDATDGGGAAILRVTRPGEEPYTTTFTLAMAKDAGLLSNGMWTKYPDKMLRARCVSSVGKAYYADVLAGVYLPGEISDDPRTEGALQLESTAGGRPMITAHSQTLPAPGGVPAPAQLPASTEAAPPAPRPIADVLQDITDCAHVAKLDGLIREARGQYKQLTPQLQSEVLAVVKSAPELVAQRQHDRIEAEAAERALAAAGGPLDHGDTRAQQTGQPEPGANDEPDPVDAALAAQRAVGEVPNDVSDIDGVF